MSRVGVSVRQCRSRLPPGKKIRANSEAEADELLKKLDLTIEQNGNDVAAISRNTRSRRWDFTSAPGRR